MILRTLKGHLLASTAARALFPTTDGFLLMRQTQVVLVDKARRAMGLQERTTETEQAMVWNRYERIARA